MKRSLYIFPLMAFTAMTLVLAGCDDTAEDQTTDTAVTAPATDEAATSVMPEATETVAPAAVAAAVSAEGANAYATAEGATTGAIFLTLHNSGTEADRLIGASTAVSPTVEIHENVVAADGTMQMSKVDGVDVPAGQQVSLSPNGYHIMLMGLSAPLVQGETFDVTLDFDKAPDVTVPVTITAPGGVATGTDASASMDHSTMDHGTTADVPAEASDVPATDEPVAETAPTTEAPVSETPSYGSTMPGEAAESSPSATTDTPTADVPAAQ